MHNHFLFEKLSTYILQSLIINSHIFSNNARVRKRKNVGVGFQTKGIFIFIIVFQISRPNSNKLSFSDPFEFEIKNLTKPDLTTFINHSYFTCVVINFKELSMMSLLFVYNFQLLFFIFGDIARFG